MADQSMLTDDEYVSPDEFIDELVNDEITRDLKNKLNVKTKQLENMEREKNEAHKYINEISAKIALNGELAKEVKHLRILNEDLEKRLQVEDKAYAKLWKEVSPSKDNGSSNQRGPGTTPKKHKENDTNSKQNSDKCVEQKQDTCVSATMSSGELTDIIRQKEERIRRLENEVKTLMSSQQETLKTKDKYKKLLEKRTEEKQALSEEASRLLTERDNMICKTKENLRLMTTRNAELEKDLEEAKGNQISTKKTMTKDIQACESTMAEDKKETSSEIKMLRQEVDTLRKHLETSHAECKAILLKNEELKKLLEEKENAQGKMEQHLASILARKEQLEKDVEKAKEELDLMAKTLAEVNQDYKSTLAETETRSVEYKNLQMKNQELIDLLEERETTKNELDLLEMERKISLDNKSTLAENATRDNELRALELKNKEQEKLLEELENIIKESKAGELGEMFKEKESNRNNENDQQVNLSSLTVQPEKKKDALEIGVRSLGSGMGKTMVDSVTRGLEKLLQIRLRREKMKFHIKPSQTLDDVTDGPLFVLCLAKSIVGKKVKALEGISGNKDTFLIIIYYTDTEESLSLSNPNFRLYASELRQLGGTMDMAFCSGNGFYGCDVNSSAVERMTRILKKY